MKTVLKIFSLNYCCLTSAVSLKAQFEQQTESAFPTKWAFILYVSMGTSLEKRNKNLNASLSVGRTWTWWNIWLISPIIVNCSSWNFNKHQRDYSESQNLQVDVRLMISLHLCSSVKIDSNFVSFVYIGDCVVGNLVGFFTGCLAVCLIQLCCLTFWNVVFHCLFVPFR